MTRWYLGGVWFWRVPAGISWRIQPVPSDLVSQAWSHLFLLTLPQLAKSPPFLPLWARYLEQRLASRDHANKVLKSVDSTGWSEIVQLIQDEVEAKYDRRNFLNRKQFLSWHSPSWAVDSDWFVEMIVSKRIYTKESVRKLRLSDQLFGEWMLFYGSV